METIYNWTIMKNNTVYEYIQGSSKAVKKHLKELRCKNPGFHILISMMTLILLLTMRNIRVKFCLEI